MPMPYPLVSIVMPTYNQADHIRDAIWSVLLQSYPNWELTIVDDGSTDGTKEIISEFYNGPDKRIRRFASSFPNAGTATALNIGFEKCKGQYWTWVSSDNVMHTDWLRRQVDVLLQGSLMVYSPYLRQPGKIVGGLWTPSAGATLFYPPHGKKLVESVDCHIGPCFLYDRNLHASVGEHRGEISHDYDWWLRAEEVTRFELLPTPLCTYRVHNERVTVTRRSTFDADKWQKEARERRAK